MNVILKSLVMISQRTAIAVLACASIAGAQAAAPPIMEGLFGPTATNAVIGNGGMSVGISRAGELVVLKWPSPSFYDHLTYRTQNPAPFGWTIEQYDRYLQAGQRWGSFAGVRYRTAITSGVSWFREAEWTQRQGYYAEDAPIVTGEFRCAALGLTVRGTDLVKHDADVLIRNYEVRLDATSPVLELALIYVANLAPCNTNPSHDPTTDWRDDSLNGFAAAYHSGRGAFLAFRPNAAAADASKVPAHGTSAAVVDAFVDGVDAAFPAQSVAGTEYGELHTRDIYLALGSSAMPSAQIMLPDSGSPADLPSPFVSDGRRVSRGPTLLALEYPLSVQAGGSAALPIYLAAASRGAQAFARLDAAVQTGFTAELQRTAAHWSARMATAVLPATDDAKIIRVLKRTLVNLLISVDRHSGMIVSAIATQPPYGVDWTRDGSLYNYVLNLAGFPEIAQKHGEFHARIQRAVDGQDRRHPTSTEAYAGSWAQCYYADGRPAWEYDFEIDEVGYGIWSMWVSAAFLEGPARTAYLARVYPAIRRAADLLVRLRDPANGLQITAQEDDLPFPAQTQYGASTTLFGLKAAIAAGIAMQEEPATMDRWRERLAELDGAIDRAFWKPGTRTFEVGLFGVMGGILMWPGQYLPLDDPRMASHADAVYEEIQPFFTKADSAVGHEWWYVGKAVTGLADYWRTDPVRRAKLKANIDVLIKDVPTQDTLIYGETLLVRDAPGRGRIYDMRVGNPMNFESCYSYVAARLFYGPNAPAITPHGSSFAGWDPPSGGGGGGGGGGAPPASGGSGGGCGGGSGSALALLAAGLLVVLRWRGER